MAGAGGRGGRGGAGGVASAWKSGTGSSRTRRAQEGRPEEARGPGQGPATRAPGLKREGAPELQGGKMTSLPQTWNS